MSELEPPTTSRLFQVNRTSYTKHYDIVAANDDQALYYVAQSAGYSSKTPDLVLHSGPDSTGPILAVSYMFRLERGFKIGFGDPASETVQWEDMTTEGRGASEHRRLRFSCGQNNTAAAAAAAAAANTTGSSEKKEFVWKRTHSAEVAGEKPKALSVRNFKLLDAETGDVLAVFLSKASFTRCGVLQVNVDRGRDFDVMVFITCLSLYEKSKRRAHGAPLGKAGS